MVKALRDIIARNRAGATVAIPSVCSAHPDVLRASLRFAQRLDRMIVIEATSNQVNQDGGYTGLTPLDFVSFVNRIADAAHVDRERIILGGDHLGPQAWRSHDADVAMAKAKTLVADYAAAGFGKIHLDCSEGCAGEAAQLPDHVTAARSAQLARISAAHGEDLLFVVGTEVPPPGGAREDDGTAIPPTNPDDARATMDAHDDAFGDLAPLIGGLVVQPGVEFGPLTVHRLPIDRDPGLLHALSDHPDVCLEAHSTDYQQPAAYPRLARLGFAFQKVGPALTHAYRQAIYALDGLADPAGTVQRALEAAMLADPRSWRGHYHGDATELYQQRHFALADRARYYWPQPAVQDAVTHLCRGFAMPIPDVILRQVFADEVLDLADDLSGDQVTRLIDAQIMLALQPYFFEQAT